MRRIILARLRLQLHRDQPFFLKKHSAEKLSWKFESQFIRPKIFSSNSNGCAFSFEIFAKRLRVLKRLKLTVPKSRKKEKVLVPQFAHVFASFRDVVPGGT